jgi:hypothetical protein
MKQLSFTEKLSNLLASLLESNDPAVALDLTG